MNDEIKLGAIIWPNLMSPLNICCYVLNEKCSILATGTKEGSIILFRICENLNKYENKDYENSNEESNENIDKNDEYIKYKNVKISSSYNIKNKNNENMKLIKSISINDKEIECLRNEKNDDYFLKMKSSESENKFINKKETNDINFIPYCILINDTCASSVLQLNFGLSCCTVVECITKEILISLHINNEIYLWSLDEGRCFKVLKNINFHIYNMRILPDRRFLLLSGEKDIILLDLWAKKEKEIIAQLVIDHYDENYSNNTNKNYINNTKKKDEELNENTEEYYIGDKNDKFDFNSCSDNFSNTEKKYFYSETDSNEDNIMDENQKKINSNKRYGTEMELIVQIKKKKIVSIATGIVPYLKNQNQRYLIQCFKLLNRNLFNDKKDMSYETNIDYIHNYNNNNNNNIDDTNQEQNQKCDDHVHNYFNTLFSCPTLVCASLNNGDIICWDLTDFLKFYKSQCRFVIRTEKTEMELFNELVQEISENCLYDDLIKNKINLNTNMNLKSYDKYIKYDKYVNKIYEKNKKEIYLIYATFISNLPKSDNILEIASVGNSNQINIIDKYIIILQKTRLIIYEKQYNSSFYIPLMDIFCPDFKKSKKKNKSSYWVGLQVLRRPLWKFSYQFSKKKNIQKKKKKKNILI